MPLQGPRIYEIETADLHPPRSEVDKGHFANVAPCQLPVPFALAGRQTDACGVDDYGLGRTEQGRLEREAIGSCRVAARGAGNGPARGSRHGAA